MDKGPGKDVTTGQSTGELPSLNQTFSATPQATGAGANLSNLGSSQSPAINGRVISVEEVKQESDKSPHRVQQVRAKSSQEFSRSEKKPTLDYQDIAKTVLSVAVGAAIGLTVLGAATLGSAIGISETIRQIAGSVDSSATLALGALAIGGMLGLTATIGATVGTAYLVGQKSVAGYFSSLKKNSSTLTTSTSQETPTEQQVANSKTTPPAESKKAAPGKWVTLKTLARAGQEFFSRSTTRKENAELSVSPDHLEPGEFTQKFLLYKGDTSYGNLSNVVYRSVIEGLRLAERPGAAAEFADAVIIGIYSEANPLLSPEDTVIRFSIILRECGLGELADKYATQMVANQDDNILEIPEFDPRVMKGEDILGVLTAEELKAHVSLDDDNLLEIPDVNPRVMTGEDILEVFTHEELKHYLALDESKMLDISETSPNVMTGEDVLGVYSHEELKSYLALDEDNLLEVPSEWPVVVETPKIPTITVENKSEIETVVARTFALEDMAAYVKDAKGTFGYLKPHLNEHGTDFPMAGADDPSVLQLSILAGLSPKEWSLVVKSLASYTNIPVADVIDGLRTDTMRVAYAHDLPVQMESIFLKLELAEMQFLSEPTVKKSIPHTVPVLSKNTTETLAVAAAAVVNKPVEEKPEVAEVISFDDISAAAMTARELGTVSMLRPTPPLGFPEMNGQATNAELAFPILNEQVMYLSAFSDYEWAHFIKFTKDIETRGIRDATSEAMKKEPNQGKRMQIGEESKIAIRQVTDRLVADELVARVGYADLMGTEANPQSMIEGIERGYSMLNRAEWKAPPTLLLHINKVSRLIELPELTDNDAAKELAKSVSKIFFKEGQVVTKSEVLAAADYIQREFVAVKEVIFLIRSTIDNPSLKKKFSASLSQSFQSAHDYVTGKAGYESSEPRRYTSLAESLKTELFQELGNQADVIELLAKVNSESRIADQKFARISDYASQFARMKLNGSI